MTGFLGRAAALPFFVHFILPGRIIIRTLPADLSEKLCSDRTNSVFFYFFVHFREKRIILFAMDQLPN